MMSSSASELGCWRASTTVTLHKRNSDWSVGEAVAGVKLPANGSAGCVTDQSGRRALSSATIRNMSSTRATVTGASGPLMTYDAAQNTVTELVVTMP